MVYFYTIPDPSKPKVVTATKEDKNSKDDKNSKYDTNSKDDTNSKYDTNSKDDKDGDSKSEGSGVNVPLIASIVACVVIIVIATVFIVYRRKSKTNKSKGKIKTNNEDEKAGFFCAGQNRRLTSPRKDRGSLQEKMIFQQGQGPRDSPIDCGYLSGNEMVYPNQQPMFVTAYPTATAAYMPGQQYINWPMPAGYPAQHPQMANMATAMYPYKQSVEQINPTGVYYAKSSGEN